jgi:hypothetical protein
MVSMAVIAPIELDNLVSPGVSSGSLPVYPLATRTADMTASVPDDTNLTVSSGFTLSIIISASSTSVGVAVPKLMPCDTASLTAATTSG